MTEYKYVSWPEYGNLAEALAEKVRSSGKLFDLVIGIARGGMPVAMVVSDRLDVRIDFINVKSYVGISERGIPRILSTLTEEVSGKRVLVVDDLVDQGDTIQVVKEYLSEQGPRLLEVAVLFKKPWTKIEPDYYLEVVDRWVVFPFELTEVNRLRIANGEVSAVNIPTLHTASHPANVQWSSNQAKSAEPEFQT
ncbi:MAG TPA: phosphoribosyltransferase [Nitrososphaerales archaeon]|nr:phosphoribosyltransferase [Nitrososphaerales archaeon]